LRSRFIIPLQRRGARRAGWLIQALKPSSTTPSGYACHPSSGGEFFSIKLLFAFILLLSAFLLSSCADPILSGAAAIGVIYKRQAIENVVSDEKIASDINAAYFENESLWQKSRVIVAVNEGNVLLTGEVPTQDLRSQAVSLAKAVEGVQHCYNQISIDTPVSFLQQAKDSAITFMVKTRMFFASNFDPSVVQVVTNDNTVYLLGIVSLPEAERAGDIASTTAGVQKVVKIFQYIT
jgi:osmotically-inducible protein OsmY